MTAIILSAVIVFLLVPYIISILKKEIIDDEIRRKAGSSDFIKLSHGYVEYELSGPEDGDPVVLVSGFTIPFFCWDYVFDALTAEGYRTLRYNHYGRGLSDHAGVRYDACLFEEQIDELTEKLGIRTPFTLVGLSMGGAVTVYYANRHKDKIKRAALVSPAGFPVHVNPAMNILRVPVLGEYIFTVFGDSFLKGKNVANVISLNEHPEYHERFTDYLKYRGRTAALLSTLRYMPVNNIEEEYEKFPSDIPLLLMWGREDAVIPFSNNELVRKAIKQTEFYPVENAGHNSQYEAPEEILIHLLKFLK